MNYVKLILRPGLLTMIVLLAIQPGRAQKQISMELTIIAHRGGIVDSLHVENSLASVNDAIIQGYKMIEVDLRETADGRALLHHDADFLRYYNYPTQVEDMTWKEIKKLRNDVDGSRPILFRELAKSIKGKISLMLDIKGNTYSASFYKEVDEALRKNGLMNSTLILGGRQAKDYFQDIPHSIEFDNLLKAAKNGEDVGKKYYLFMLASQLDAEKVKVANQLGVTVIAAVNVFRYTNEGKDEFIYAKQDIDRLRKLDVTHFQIDSVYEKFFH